MIATTSPSSTSIAHSHKSGTVRFGCPTCLNRRRLVLARLKQHADGVRLTHYFAERAIPSIRDSIFVAFGGAE